jgi:hypothetical protein
VPVLSAFTRAIFMAKLIIAENSIKIHEILQKSVALHIGLCYYIQAMSA